MLLQLLHPKMSHSLLLFDPDFLFVVDDDTYVNAKLLAYGSVIIIIIIIMLMLLLLL